MSPRTPRLTATEIVKILQRHGFVKASQVGSHLKLFNPETRRIAIVPMHQGKVLPIGTIKAIEKQANIQFGLN
jgi:predicted RNA binding protein YcfA (HicA-like mRNA interferase family)